MEKSFYLYLIIVPFLFISLSCQKKFPYDLSEQGFQNFLNRYETVMAPLMTSYNQSQWDAYITGKQTFFEATNTFSLKIDSVYQTKDHFAYLKQLRQIKIIENPLLKRQLEILYNDYLGKQIDPDLNKEITETGSKIEQIFANFRAAYNGKTYTDNKVTEILQTARDSKFREAIWRAQKAIGDQVAPVLIKLAKLRNESARQLGYQSFYELAMTSHELDPLQVENIFEKLQQLTEEPFAEIHNQIENVFAGRYHIKKSEIRPWHYEDLFAQSVPSIFDINLDTYYKNTDIPEVAADFYSSVRLEVKDILARSDLYEREGKSQHAFSFFIDRKQDIRILCNIVPNERWMETMLHELGHAIYDKYLDPSMPFLLREPAHSFTTEGIAMMFGGYSSNAAWIQRALGISTAEKKKIEEISRANLRLSKLIFARWSMVVLNFEKAFYQNPDQDLNSLWWNLVEKYQKIKRPDNPAGNEWASKVHIATYPVYYQNYQLGELFASQVLNTIAEKVYRTEDLEKVIFWDKPEAGNFLKEKIFRVGKRLPWNNMIEAATGKPLSAEFFVRQYVHR